MSYIERPYEIVKKEKKRFETKQRNRLKQATIKDKDMKHTHKLARFFPECREKMK